ncbi:single-stranded-DNA-specific exonuclease RecJ, partial [Candidatus Parcubacteria bacterium]
VYADFDCDGIPGAAVLSDFFTKIGHANFEVYLPHRDREGYGLHKDAIRELAERGTTLIITVDVGTNAQEPVRYARELGIDTIVTDHHEITGALPDCVAVLNPKLGSYPFRELCGAAVAFKLAQALIIEGKRMNMPRFTATPTGWEKWLLDMVAIATVADMVPLVGENRALVHFGLKVLQKSQRAGIAALCDRLRLRRSSLTEDEIAFSIAPRINAASRMDEPDLAFQLLTTTDSNEADKLAAHLESLNARRKSVVAGVVKQARRNVSARYTQDARVVVLGDPEWKPALLGLAANSILAERSGIVCLWGRDATGRLKGSCRSDGSVSITELFSNASDAFEEYGGHAFSGGFSVSHESVHTLGETLSRAAEALELSKTRDAREHDALATLPEISSALFGEVSRLAPFGIGNPKPVFQVCDIIVTGVRRFGRDSAHIELQLECRRTGSRARAFDFFRSPEGFTHAPAEGKETRILATIERDSYRGGLALRLVDMLKPA